MNDLILREAEIHATFRCIASILDKFSQDDRKKILDKVCADFEIFPLMESGSPSDDPNYSCPQSTGRVKGKAGG